MTHKRGHKSRGRKTRRGGESVMASIRAKQSAAENKKLVDQQNTFDPFGPSPSSTVDITSPAVGVALKKINEESYGKPDGFATRVAERLKAAKYTKEGTALNPDERGVGGKKSRRRSTKRLTRRRR